MPNDNDRETPAEGVPAVEDEPPTSPDLARPACPACKGAGGTLTVWWEGSVHRGRMVRCDYCGGTGVVERDRHAAYHATLKAARSRRRI